MSAALPSLYTCTCHTSVMTGGHALCRRQSRRWLSIDRHACYIAGYNVCIFAYGQTGSGKTHTMAGSDVEDYAGRGINYRALDDLFAINEERQGEVRLAPLIISVSMMAGLKIKYHCVSKSLYDISRHCAAGPLQNNNIVTGWR